MVMCMFNKINPIITTNFKSKNISQETKNPDLLTEKKKTKDVSAVKICTFALAIPAAIALTYLAVIEHKKPKRLSFQKLLEQNNLEFKNDILIIKNTGEKYTGELKRSTGEFFPNGYGEKIESQKFEKGIITEKTYVNSKGHEIQGYFYKNGKLRYEVFSNGKRNKNNELCFGFNDYNEKGQPSTFGDGMITKNKSLFETARKYVENHNWG